MDLDLEALAVNIGDLQGQGFMEPEAQAIDGSEVDLSMQGGSRLEDTSDFFNTEDGGETVGGLCAQERQRGPVACEDVLTEEADAAVADAQRGWCEAIGSLGGREGSRERLFRDGCGAIG